MMTETLVLPTDAIRLLLEKCRRDINPLLHSVA